MVAPEHHDRVFAQAGFVQRIQHATHLPVGVADAGQIGAPRVDDVLR